MSQEIDFSGMTAPAAPDYVAACPAACTKERCVISTVGICKHPCLTASTGCGPVTMANRKAAQKFLGILISPQIKSADVVR